MLAPGCVQVENACVTDCSRFTISGECDNFTVDGARPCISTVSECVTKNKTLTQLWEEGCQALAFPACAGAFACSVGGSQCESSFVAPSNWTAPGDSRHLFQDNRADCETVGAFWVADSCQVITAGDTACAAYDNETCAGMQAAGLCNAWNGTLCESRSKVCSTPGSNVSWTVVWTNESVVLSGSGLQPVTRWEINSIIPLRGTAPLTLSPVHPPGLPPVVGVGGTVEYTLMFPSLTDVATLSARNALLSWTLDEFTIEVLPCAMTLWYKAAINTYDEEVCIADFDCPAPTPQPTSGPTQSPTESPTTPPTTRQPTWSPTTQTPTTAGPTESPTTQSPTALPTTGAPTMPTTQAPTPQPPTMSPTHPGGCAWNTTGVVAVNVTLEGTGCTQQTVVTPRWECDVHPLSPWIYANTPPPNHWGVDNITNTVTLEFDTPGLMAVCVPGTWATQQGTPTYTGFVPGCHWTDVRVFAGYTCVWALTDTMAAEFVLELAAKQTSQNILEFEKPPGVGRESKETDGIFVSLIAIGGSALLIDLFLA